MERQLNQAKTKSFRRAPLFKFGYQVPRSHSDCVAIDMKNENTKWQEAEALEMKQLAEFDFKKKVAVLRKGTNGSMSTLSTMSSTMVVTKHALLLLAISRMSPLRVYARE